MKIHKCAAIIACALITSCTSSAPRQELVRGIQPLGKDLFASISEDRFEHGKFQASDGTTIPYRLLEPSRLTAGATYPLVLQLHGSGGIGADNVSQLDRLAKSWAMPDIRERYQAFVLVPQFPVRSANYGPATPDQRSEPTTALGSAMELVHDFSARHPVEKSRIYVVGFSMGGSSAWLSPTLEPSLFAAIVPISGVAPDDSLAGIYRELPVLIIHGDSDTENPITSDRRFYQSVKGTGGVKIILREYGGLDHQLPADVYPGLWWRDWLFGQARR
jgi:predicted peptidase